MGNGLLAFAAGLGRGYLSAKEKDLERERQATLDSQNKQLFDARMAEVAQVKNDRKSLADAGKLATVSPGFAIQSEGQLSLQPDEATANFAASQQASEDGGEAPAVVPALNLSAGTQSRSFARDVGLADANAAATEYNLGREQRVVDAKFAMGDPIGAMQFDASAKQASLANMELPLKKQQTAQKLRDEGALATSKAMLIGRPSLVREIFNQQGDMRLDKDPIVKKQVRDIPGVGKIDTFDYEGTLVGKDGKTEPFKINSHDFAMSILPYKDFMEASRKLVKSDADIESRSDLLELKGKQITLNNELGLARIEAAQAKLASGGAPTREERLRYTNLFSDAGRRMHESQKTAATLSKSLSEQAVMNGNAPDTPEMKSTRQQLADLQNDYNSYKEERTTYQALLAGSQGAAKPGLASGKPGSSASTMPQPKNKADYDKIPKGASYIYTDGSTRVKS